MSDSIRKSVAYDIGVSKRNRFVATCDSAAIIRTAPSNERPARP